MTNIILSGCCGKMGRVIAEEVSLRNDCEIVAGVDIFSDSSLKFPIYSSFDNITEEADVIIDFSNPSALDGLLKYATGKSVPVVICTTGFSAEQVCAIKKAAENTAVFYSGNMSLGINLISPFIIGLKALSHFSCPPNITVLFRTVYGYLLLSMFSSTLLS